MHLLHKWEKWRIESRELTEFWNDNWAVPQSLKGKITTRTVRYQVRTCTICGKYQEERINK